MSYRHFFGAALAAACLAVPAAGIAQQKQVWKASDVHPLGYPTVEAIVRMGKKLEAQTNGRISIQMYPQMQLGGEKEMIEQAQVGALQIARISVGACSIIPFSPRSCICGYIWMQLGGEKEMIE